MNTRQTTLFILGAGALLVISSCATRHDFLSSKLGQHSYSCDAKEIVLESKKGNVKVKKGERTGAEVNTEVTTWYCGRPDETNAQLIECESGTNLIEVARNYSDPEFTAYCYSKTGRL